MGDIMQKLPAPGKPGSPGEKDVYMVFAGLLAVLAVLFLLFGWCLSVAGTGPTVFDALKNFFAGRMKGSPWSTDEILGTLFFFATTAVLVTAGYYVWKRVENWWRQRKRMKYIRERQASAQGTSEWAAVDELKKLTGDDGVIIGAEKVLGRLRPVRLAERYSCEHIAVIGPTGCGKSTCFFMPNLLTLPDGVSVVVTDPKGELEEETGGKLRERGWDVVTFAPFNPEISVGYDPLRAVRNSTEISDMAETILRNGYAPDGGASDTQWVTFSVPLLEAALYAVKSTQRRRGTVHDAVELITTKTEKDRMELMRQVGGMALERYLTYMQSLQSPETAGSIRTVLTASVRVFERPDVRGVARKEQLSFLQLRERPTALFIRIPERKAHLLKPLMATFFWQLLEHIADVKGCPVFFFLDEFPNIGKIPGFAGMAATLRSRRIALCLGLQGVEQLAREYSEYEQKDILNNLKTKVFFPGLSGESGRYVNELTGFATTEEDGHKQRVELLAPAELRTIPDGKTLVVTRNLPPVLLDVLHYSNLEQKGGLEQANWLKSLLNIRRLNKF